MSPPLLILFPHSHRFPVYPCTSSPREITMGWFSSDSDQSTAYDEVNAAPHKAALSHELIGAAAAYEAAKAYEDHCAANGKPDSHAKAKEIMAALTGGIIDRMVETKGLDMVDREKAKHEGRHRP
ncbi:hypothetical protein C8F04DRAFT_1064011 [Mycena alexandri]|uniref:CipC1 protein n=1 Tax=Mycena alexandri TaxID=1745969 RepID=A0AAD6XFJ3_9AGAR|nr:hypothetical protein C8F04DRAFT_1064011 [Mycena alexandri]